VHKVLAGARARSRVLGPRSANIAFHIYNSNALQHSKGTIIYTIGRRAKQRAVDRETLVGRMADDPRTGLEGASSEVEEQDMRLLLEERRF